MSNAIKYNDNDDLKYAIRYNGLEESFNESEIEEIVAEVPGENDGAYWYWIVRLTSGKFSLLVGCCDYTGWDCQSGLDVEGIFDTELQAAESAIEKDSYGRPIRKNLVGQVKGTYPKFTLWEQN
ncbi:MAG: hypothetical protein M0R06_02030 [Sphaerochaeta sp.]|jgi:hypothetical protein|nr:hypothetical protein [Sphaerochaeta sp.]